MSDFQLTADSPRMDMVPATPMLMLARAIDSGADIAKLEKLMDLAERWEASEARKAFTSAMAQFKAHPPAILKNKQVGFGNTKYSHATLGSVCAAVVSSLASHGMSHRWNVEQTDKTIKVTCVLTHSQGHFEEVSLSASADTSGSKNAIQAVGSAVTYLQRYTLLSACGLAAMEEGVDDDARSACEARSEVGEVFEPGARREPETPPERQPAWQELAPDGWQDCSMPNGGCYGDLLAVPDCNKVLFKAWAAHRSSPALCAWAAGWITSKLKEMELPWGQLLNSPRLESLRIPSEFYDLNAGQLWAVATEVRTLQVEAAKGGAK